jgi:hypothetical protein
VGIAGASGADLPGFSGPDGEEQPERRKAIKKAERKNRLCIPGTGKITLYSPLGRFKTKGFETTSLFIV